MHIVGIILEIHHLNRPLILRHEDKHVTIAGVEMVLMFYDFKQPVCTAAHIFDVRYEIKLLQPGNGQHTTSNLSIRCLSSVKLIPVFTIFIPSGNLMLMEIFLLMLATLSVGYLKGCLTGSCTRLSSLTFSASV